MLNFMDRAVVAENEETFNAFVVNMLHKLYYCSDAEFKEIVKKPTLYVIESKVVKDNLTRVSSLIEYIAKERSIDCPEWIFDDRLILDEPYFSWGGPAKYDYDLLLLLRAPEAFKNRNVYYDYNNLRPM